MATMSNQYGEYSGLPVRRAFSWSGIFAGTFVFLAIETTFGLLGAAIFASASNPNAAGPTTPGVTVGFWIWMIILSIIALYWAGKTSSKVIYRTLDRNFGMYHGLVTFGMSVFTTVLVLAIAMGSGSTMSYGAGVGHGPLGVGGLISSGVEWELFVAFLLSMIAAAVGGMHGVGTATPAASLPLERTTSTRNAA